MRLWSIHPKYLDRQGLLAVWRESLLAQAVLRGETKGYLNHPQLHRFKSHPVPLVAMGAYLNAIHCEAVDRGYSFDSSKILFVEKCKSMPVSSGQMKYEWRHLLNKLSIRTPDLHGKLESNHAPDCHPLFEIHPGPMEKWERPSAHA